MDGTDTSVPKCLNSVASGCGSLSGLLKDTAEVRKLIQSMIMVVGHQLQEHYQQSAGSICNVRGGSGTDTGHGRHKPFRIFCDNTNEHR